MPEIGNDIDHDGAEVIDADGLVVAPSFVDMHTHVREPGREDEETIASASAAAAAGGYGAICAMPNTDPVADSAAVVEKVWALGREAGLVDVDPCRVLSLAGKKARRWPTSARCVNSVARVRMFTDDGHGVQNSLLARRVMEYLVAFDAIYAEHCEDEALAEGGEMHEGVRSVALGIARRSRRGRGDHGGSRHRAVPVNRMQTPPAAHLDRRNRRPGATGEGRGSATSRRRQHRTTSR